MGQMLLFPVSQSLKLCLSTIAAAEVLHDVKDLIYIHPDASLYDAIKMLIHNKIHRFGW